MTLKINAFGFQKLAILLYKGLLLRRRHYIVTAFEIIFPILLASVPAIILSETADYPGNSKQKPQWINDTLHSPFSPFTTGSSSCKNCIFAYAPSNKFTDALVNDSLLIWKRNQPFCTTDIKTFHNAEELEEYSINKQQSDRQATIIGTVFNVPSDQENLPSTLDYTIRYSADYMPQFSTDLKYRFSDFFTSDVYASSTYFLSWQAAVEKAFIQKKMEEENVILNYDLWMQEFPFPGHAANNNMFDWKKIIIPPMIIYGFIVFVINITRRTIEEKSNGSKELMKMMGMSDFIYWSSSFLNYFSVGAVVCLIITIIYKSPLKKGAIVLEDSNFLLIFIIFLLLVASLILFTFTLAIFFNKAVFGVTVMIIIYNLTYSLILTYVFQPGQPGIAYFSLSFLVKFCICLLPPGCVLTMFEIILSYEAIGDGIQWSNLFNTDIVLGFSVFWLIASLVFSCIIYVILIWYIDAVWPWQYGIPKPFYFPFTKSYWCGYEGEKNEEVLLDSEDNKENADFFEDDPVGISAGVVISNLSKVFRTGLQTKVAVKNVSLNIYNSEITALLGHNGAGKTTIINILTGLFQPSSGTASINGWNIFSETVKARQSLGVCPQSNVLYDTLTVEEHLKIYAVLKGVKWSNLNEESDKVLKTIDLTEKKRELAKNLSGGMKRKLSLGIAIIGGPKVLFLDEPTSGMDVETRRKVWDALLEIRPNHAIVLTTHYMEEADVLGDRIAIMANGEIQCCGSPLFLKKKFGTGYHLHLTKKENFHIDTVQDAIVKFVPDAELVNEYEGEITFNLMSSNASNFIPLFNEMEQKKETFGINSCGLTVTTMDDVFLKVASLADVKYKSDVELLNADENAEALEMKDVYIESNQSGRSQKFFNQFFGLFLKRLAYSKRHWSIFVSQLILPFLIISISLSIIRATSFTSLEKEPSLQLDVKNVYGKTDGFYHHNHTQPSDAKLITSCIEEIFKDKNINAKLVDDPNAYVLSYGTKNLVDYYKKLILGGSVISSGDKLNLTAWYNGYPYHAEPMSLLMMDVAILKAVSKSGNIKLTNHPFPRSRIYYADDNQFSKKLIANIFLPLALSFLSASFVLVPTHERTTKAKLLQMMTGLSSITYWTAMFAWDFLISIIVSILLIIPFSIFTHYAFFGSNSEGIGTAILFMILYGWSTIPFSYIFSLIFKKPNTAFSVVILICVLAGTAASPIFSVLLNLVSREPNPTVKDFNWILKVFPSYALGSGFGNLYNITFTNAFCDSVDPKYLKFFCSENPTYGTLLQCCKDICGSECLNKTNPITMEAYGCGGDILFLFLDGIIYFLIILLLESSYLKLNFHRAYLQLRSTLVKKVDNVIVDSSLPEDSDVLHEEERVLTNYEQLSHNDALISLNLTKIFGNIKAVNSLTFGIHKKECFGLLGVNGAGKTTTFRMLTGDCFPTSGNAYINSFSVITDLKKFQSHLGYCPQFDALIDRLSAREMITLFARLRGLSGPRMTRYVNALIQMTDLTQYADKPSMVYSGGNKRKLSIALALIGAPPLILLDEPTAGVDPVSRRKIWKILSLARIHSGASVILTTHSMEESDALCSRLAIMVNGRFRCLGSIQHLKSKFGQGYTVIIKLKKEDQGNLQSMNAIKEYINTNLLGASLKDDHQGMLQYHVVNTSLTLSSLFKFMDDMQRTYNLEDYVISDTSLEQIFLAFARSQRVVSAQ